MITFKDLSNFLKSVALLAFNLEPLLGQALQYEISPAQIMPGEQTTLKIKIDLKQIPPLFQDTEIISVQDELLESPSLQILNKNFKRTTSFLEWNYYLTSYLPGKIFISPVSIQIGPYNFSTERRPLEITSSRKENDYEIRSGFGFEEIPFQFPKELWVSLITIVLFSIIFYAGLKKIKKTPHPLLAEEPPKFNENEWLKEKLNQIEIRLRNKEGHLPTMTSPSSLQKGSGRSGAGTIVPRVLLPLKAVLAALDFS